jgi:hypothetical protein
MIALVITLIILVAVLVVVVINRIFIKEEDLIVKAEKNWFYHTLAKMTCSKYDGYIMGDNEKKAMEEFISKPSEYDSHPVGSYLKMRKELKGILATAGNFHGYKLNFNLDEIGTGLAVMVLFGIVVTLGVVLC